MNKTYQRLTLRSLIETLRALPESAQVAGLEPWVRSYEAFYNRNAIEPSRTYLPAHVLADAYQESEGELMAVRSGEAILVDLNQPVYLAGSGESGSHIIGIEPDDNGIYRPVLLQEDWF